MAILLTGGAGYIGSHTAWALRRAGFEVLIYDNLSTCHRRLAAGFELIEGDIADDATLRLALARVDAVIHFAAHAYVGESVENPRKYFRNNVSAALHLLNMLLECGIRKLVFSSSCAVYGIPKHLPIHEMTPREPINPYGASKLFFEHALEAYDRAYQMRSVRLRYFNAAGADESGEIGEIHSPETHLIPLLLAATSLPCPGTTCQEVPICGSDYPTKDGTCVRDYVHVNDLADAHVRALQYLEKGGSSDAFNLGTGRGQSILEVIAAVERVTGRPVRRKFSPRREGDPPTLVADSSKARRVLGWSATRSLEDMVSSAHRWMLKNSAASRCPVMSSRGHNPTSGAFIRRA